MNGKGCVYTEQIDRELEFRKNRKAYAGFMVLPFQPNISVFYELCLKRYIQGAYGTSAEPVEIMKADQVRKTGYIICEKICKKIQESDFVVVDVSVPNANVFYELGLAYGIGQKILIVYHKGSNIGEYVTSYFTGASAYSYADLTPLSINQFQLSNYIWERERRTLVESSPITLILDSLNLPGNRADDSPTSSENEPKSNPNDIELDFSTHIGASVGVAIDNILQRIKSEQQSEQQTVKIPKTYFPLIEQLKNGELVQSNASFREILEKINQSFCTIIRTGGKDCNPMMYFWLGYCHAQGKNVIPITAINKFEDVKNNENKIDDLAFDIRALWHMTFDEKVPVRLESELEETLRQMIISDFVEWSRKRFWDDVLEKRGKVSIFTGALHNPIGREMIGDWDLRAASELTSYFASHQYRATIESPVYQIEQVVDKQKAVERDQYIEELEKMLTDKNCIIIASPDVNPLTEIVLGKIYGISQTNWFDPNFNVERIPNAVIAFKQTEAAGKYNANTSKVKRTFYREIAEGIKDKTERGFKASFLNDREISGQFISQTETENPSEFIVHAHLAIVPNPYRSEHKEEEKYIVILNGVSGPATFALTHVLTGGVSKESVSYESGFDPNSESEKIMKQILEDLNTLKKKKQSTGIQYIIQVKVGPPEQIDPQAKGTSRGIFDWRHIRHWELIKTTDMFSLKTDDKLEN
jgi:hypothetical protein